MGGKKDTKKGPKPPPQFALTVIVEVTKQSYRVKNVQYTTLVKDLKYRLEEIIGIPAYLQRLRYLDAGDLVDDTPLETYDVVPDARITLVLYSEWDELIAAVYANEMTMVFSQGVIDNGLYKRPAFLYMGPADRKKAIRERAFVTFFLAAHCAHHPICIKMLDSGVPINQTTPAGRSALHVCAAIGQDKMIPFLLERGANAKLVDGEGHIALEIAKLNGHKDSEKLILQFGKVKTVPAKKTKPAATTATDTPSKAAVAGESSPSSHATPQSLPPPAPTNAPES